LDKYITTTLSTSRKR
jgi:hypothetical protein